VYAGTALLYVVTALTLLPLPLTGYADSRGRSVWTDLKAGVGYLSTCSILIPLLALVFARGLLGMPYRTFMPKYAEDVMHLDAQGLGILLSAPGVGSLISSLVIASLGNYRGKGRLFLIAGVVFGGFLILFASTQSLALVLIFLAVVGAASNACMVTNQTLIQTSCAAPYRGRVMSMYMMMFGLTQLGTIPAGALADSLGVPTVLWAQGALLALTFVLVWILLPKVRRLA